MSAKKKNNTIPSPIELENEQKEKTVLVTLDKTPETQKLTPLQKKLAMQMVAHPEKTEEEQCRDAGYKVKEGSRTSGIMVAMKGKLADSLEIAGIHLPRIFQVISEGLSAEVAHIVKKPIKDKDGNVVGEKVTTFGTPDHRTRLQYVNIALKLGQRMPSTKIEVEGEVDHKHKHFIAGELYNNVPVINLRKRADVVRKEIEAEYEIIDEKVA